MLRCINHNFEVLILMFVDSIKFRIEYHIFCKHFFFRFILNKKKNLPKEQSIGTSARAETPPPSTPVFSTIPKLQIDITDSDNSHQHSDASPTAQVKPISPSSAIAKHQPGNVSNIDKY